MNSPVQLVFVIFTTEEIFLDKNNLRTFLDKYSRIENYGVRRSYSDSVVLFTRKDHIIVFFLTPLTRTKIMQCYEDDLKQQGLSFPKLDAPLSVLGTHTKKAGMQSSQQLCIPTLRSLELSKLRNRLIDRHFACSNPIIRLPELYNSIIH